MTPPFIDMQRFKPILPFPGVFFSSLDERDAAVRRCIVADSLAAGPDGLTRGFDEMLATLPEERLAQATELSLSSGGYTFPCGPDINTGAQVLTRCTFLAYLEALPNLTSVEIINVKWRACEKAGNGAVHDCRIPHTYPKITLLILDRIEMVSPFDVEPLGLLHMTPRLRTLKVGLMDIPPYPLLPQGPLPLTPTSIHEFTAVFPTCARWGLHDPKPHALQRLTPNFPAASSLELLHVDCASGSLAIANAMITASKDSLESIKLVLTRRAQDEDGADYAAMALGTCRQLKHFSVVLEITVGQHGGDIPFCTSLPALLGCLPSTVTHVRIGLMLFEQTQPGMSLVEPPRLRALQRVPWWEVVDHLSKLPLEALVVSGDPEMRLFVEEELEDFQETERFFYHEVY